MDTDDGYEASYDAYSSSDAVFTTGTLTEDFTKYDELDSPEITNAATAHPLRGAFRRRKRGVFGFAFVCFWGYNADIQFLPSGCGSIQPGKALSTVGEWSSLNPTTDSPTLSTTRRARPRSRLRSTQNMVRPASRLIDSASSGELHSWVPPQHRKRFKSSSSKVPVVCAELGLGVLHGLQVKGYVWGVNEAGACG
ncbi:hypothetical protein BDV98DRAFT_599077 [Pterulicium gracile]|uniref:Uncharacterized protein n=1 Tax=Pterulicium gracile TaxID=1884261 RepID=A0A5C3Q0M2_9AGAR|nr:hypothetical protein BDV98DRAFT_599077 [Pterula gracilis]